jgi:hypothetical protein
LLSLSTRPRLQTSLPAYLHDLQTSSTGTIKREGRSPCTATAGRIAGISRMVGKS